MLRLVAIAVSLLYFIVTDTVAAARAIAYADSFDVVDELIQPGQKEPQAGVSAELPRMPQDALHLKP